MHIFMDRITVFYDEIRPIVFQDFLTGLSNLEAQVYCPEVKTWVGKRASEYHHNVKIGDGEGAIVVQYKHNSKSEREPFYSVRVEYNPQKVDTVGFAIEWLKECFVFEETKFKDVRLKNIDLAIDVPIHNRKIIIHSKQGREENRIRGDRYFGSRGKHGRLKCYDKKREREEKGFKVDEKQLTRLEFTWKGDVSVWALETVGFKLGFSDLYTISILGGLETMEVKAEVKAMVLAVMSGEIQIKEYSRTNQKKVKEVMENLDKIDLDEEFEANIKEIQRQLLYYTVEHNEYGREYIPLVSSEVERALSS